jgi:hypothetical protein
VIIAQAAIIGWALPAGEHQVRLEFAYAGGGLGRGGQVTLYVDGEKAGEAPTRWSATRSGTAAVI